VRTIPFEWLHEGGLRGADLRMTVRISGVTESLLGRLKDDEEGPDSKGYPIGTTWRVAGRSGGLLGWG
jgi:hypothetical protein